MSKGYIFISYRRQDSAGYAGRIYDHLAEEFGNDKVFMDVDQIHPGEDFVQVIGKSLKSCDVFITMIGNQWATAQDSEGNRRLDNKGDFVRLEVGGALKRDILVIPVLVNGAEMPKTEDLPEDLASLSRRNALEIRHEHFNKDITELISAVRKGLDEADRKRAAAKRGEISRVNLAWWRALPLWGKGLIIFLTLSVLAILGFGIAELIPSGGGVSELTQSIPSSTPDLTRAALEEAINNLQTQVASAQDENTPTPNLLMGTIKVAIQEIQEALPKDTATVIPEAVIDYRTATIQALLTQASIAQTQNAPGAPTITSTSLPTPTHIPSEDSTASGMPFEAQQGSPLYFENLTHPELECSWMGVAGQVFDDAATPITSLVVQVGSLAPTGVEGKISLTGSAVQYGPGGFEIELSDAPFDSSYIFYLQLLTIEGQKLSEKIYFNTYDDCNKNLIVINLSQVGRIPISADVLQGKGMFIWKLSKTEKGDPEAIVKTAQEAGLSFIAIKIADGTNEYNVSNENDEEVLSTLIDLLQRESIQVWGLHYLYGNDAEAEAKLAIQVVEEFDLDGYVLDIESHYKDTSKETSARRFMEILREGLPTLPVGLHSYRFPSYFPEVPWDAFLEECDFVMPQVYWLQASNPGSQLQQSVKEYQSMTYVRSIVPIGAAFSELNWQPTAEQVLEFMQTAQSLGLKAFAFWEWSEARELPGIWETINKFEMGSEEAD